jgi:hypothetical protein
MAKTQTEYLLNTLLNGLLQQEDMLANIRSDLGKPEVSYDAKYVRRIFDTAKTSETDLLVHAYTMYYSL